MSRVPARGETWWCELADVGRRPVVVLSRDAAIPRLRRVLVAPCTTTVRGLPSEVVLEPDEDPVRRCGLRSTSTRSRASRWARSSSAWADSVTSGCETCAPLSPLPLHVTDWERPA